MKKRWIGLTLLTVLLLALAGMASAEEEIVPNTPKTVDLTLTGEVAIYEFTPEVDGVYRYYSTSIDEDYWYDTYGYLLDRDRQLIVRNDDGGGNGQFQIIRLLNANQTYYFGAAFRSIETTGSYIIHLDEIEGVYAAAKSSRVFVPQNKQGTAEVTAYSKNGGLTYQWYDGNTPIPGATGKAYTIPALTEAKEFRCVVTDSANQTAEAVVQALIDSGLTVIGSGDGEVAYGGSTTLSVTATASYGADQITYRWYEITQHEDGGWYEDIMEGKTGSTLSLNDITHSRRIYCWVSDINERGREQWFNIYVPGSVSAGAVGGTLKEVAAGNTATLEVTAESEYPVTYRWYEQVWKEDYDEWIPLSGATESIYTTEPIYYGVRYFICEVTNSVGNSIDVYFDVSSDGSLFAEADGDTEIVIAPDETATLKVKRISGTGEVSCQWYRYSSAFERYIPVRGATSASYNVSGNGNSGWYYCVVRDPATGCEGTIWFEVSVDSTFITEADSATNLTLDAGETAELKVKVSSGAGRIFYRWYQREYNVLDDYYYEWEMIDGEQTDTLTITADKKREYECIASDLYGHSGSIIFSVGVENGFSVTAEKTQFTVNAGDPLTLSVTGCCTTGEITYRWSRYIDNYGYRLIKESNESFLAFNAVGPDECGEYRLTAYDAYDNARTFWFRVTVQNNLTAEAAGETEFSIEPGDDVTLAVDASCDSGTISYQWYQQRWYNNGASWYYDQMSNQTQNTLVLTNIQKAGEYYCRITDQFGGRREVYFLISIDNDLTAEALDDQTDFVAAPGETVTMAVDAHCRSGELTYQWYRETRYESADGGYYWDEEKINGATEASYTTGALNRAAEYYCRVKDAYGNNMTVWFWVNIDNDLMADVKDGEDWITIEPGDSATMEVDASCKAGSLTYRWYRQDHYTENGEEYWDEVRISGATGDTCTVGPLYKAGNYVCRVSDTYGNEENVWFYIRIDNDLTAYALDYETNISAEPGEPVTLTVVASCRTGSDELTYEWKVYTYNQMYDYWEDGRIIPGATSASYTVASVTERKMYRCTVKDSYGNEQSVHFYIGPDNGLTASPVGTRTRLIEAGTEVTMAVTASCKTGGISYQWYRESFYREDGEWCSYRTEISGATSSSYTETVNEMTHYCCRVQDEYGNVENIWYYINIDNKLTARSTSGRTEYTIPYGGQVTLNVTADCRDGGLIYQWYRDDYYEEYGYWESQIIPGATSASYTTDAIYSRTDYYCRVYDEYGSNTDVWFYVSTDYELTAKPDGPSVFHVSEAPITMSVAASSLRPDAELSYEWYQDYDHIEGENSNEITLTDPEPGTYYCEVSDGESESVRVWFYVTDTVIVQAYGDTYFEVAPGEQVTMLVSACNAENDLEYEWYEYDEDESEYIVISDATGPACTVTVNTGKQYYCRVTGTGVNNNIWFSTHVRNEFHTNSTGMSRINVIPAGESIQLTYKITSDYDDELTFKWSKDGEEIPDETGNTLTVDEGGQYYARVYDRYGHSTETDFYCVEGQAETVSEGHAVTGPENGNATVYQFTPAVTGSYQVEASNGIGLYRPGYWWSSDYVYSGIQTKQFTAGQTYYIILYNSDYSFKYTLIQEEQTSFTVTLQKGQKLMFPSLNRNGSIWPDYAVSSAPSVIRIYDSYNMELKKEGSATVSVMYEDGTRITYDITVVTGNTLNLPDQLTTIGQDAFNGDTSIRFVKLGYNVQTVESGAFANLGNINIIVKNYYTEFEDGAFTNSTPVIICQNWGDTYEYCRRNGIVYFILRQDD